MGPLQALLLARWSPKLGTISNYQTVSKEEFSEVHGSKRPMERFCERSRATWRDPFGLGTWRPCIIRCLDVCQGVATRNSATTREILAHRTGSQPNFVCTKFSEGRC